MDFKKISYYTVGIIFWTSFYMWASCNLLPTTKHVFEAEWKAQTFQSPQLTVELPFQLKVKDAEMSKYIPEELKEVIQEMNILGFEQTDQIMCLITQATYAEYITADLLGAAEGSITTLKNKTEFQNLEFTQQPFPTQGMIGVKQNGYFEKNATKYAFTQIIFTEENHIWQLIFSHKDGDEYGEKICDKILSSIHVETNFQPVS
ncbi:hypothetical protein [Sediminitomix flava]|uniref:Lipoprotein n=1 Tax=Sediminitomix flava TaxID=379075 RepID=A0A315Z8I9_SEDFL|nr:hypothetical protein [Sediminitomix flava]PWJ41066.1 hypothetical protein BC781_104341 [Sediminitomix flava]